MSFPVRREGLMLTSGSTSGCLSVARNIAVRQPGFEFVSGDCRRATSGAPGNAANRGAFRTCFWGLVERHGAASRRNCAENAPRVKARLGETGNPASARARAAYWWHWWNRW